MANFRVPCALFISIIAIGLASYPVSANINFLKAHELPAELSTAIAKCPVNVEIPIGLEGGVAVDENGDVVSDKPTSATQRFLEGVKALEEEYQELQQEKDEGDLDADEVPTGERSLKLRQVIACYDFLLLRSSISPWTLSVATWAQSLRSRVQKLRHTLVTDLILKYSYLAPESVQHDRYVLFHLVLVVCTQSSRATL
tara:strand:- start:163 stop:759 length:597 start_codon:yes stop_codon:yes gene_type:complete